MWHVPDHLLLTPPFFRKKLDIKTGMWVLRKLRKSMALEQLTFADAVS
jgi:hypothetical protein